MRIEYNVKNTYNIKDKKTRNQTYHGLIDAMLGSYIVIITAYAVQTQKETSLESLDIYAEKRNW